MRAVFTESFTRESSDLEYRDRLRRSVVADLRLSAAKYPTDRRMQSLLAHTFVTEAKTSIIRASVS